LFCSDLGRGEFADAAIRARAICCQKFVPADGTRLPTKPQTTIPAVVVFHRSTRTLSPQLPYSDNAPHECDGRHRSGDLKSPPDDEVPQATALTRDRQATSPLSSCIKFFRAEPAWSYLERR
jgi:hypothetical protein